MAKTTSVNDDKAITLMDMAKTARRTDPQRAIGLFRSLKQIDFRYRDYCWQQLAATLQEVGRWEEAQREFKELTTKNKTKNSFRAYNLRHLSECQIALGRFEGIEAMLDEAQQIFEEELDFFNLGLIVQLKGLVAANRGDLERAIEKIEQGSHMAETHRIQPETIEAVSRVVQPALAGIS